MKISENIDWKPLHKLERKSKQNNKKGPKDEKDVYSKKLKCQF